MTSIRSANTGGGFFGKTACLLLSSCLLLLSTPSGTAYAQEVHELVSTYEGGWIQDGVMFDVQTVATNSSSSSSGSTPDGITIHGLNVLTPQTDQFCIELYTKSGSFSSSPSTPGDWTFLGSFILLGKGASAPTPIPLGAFDPITIGVGETQAFYVTTQNENLRYTALDVDKFVTGDVYASSEPNYDESNSVATELISVGNGKENEVGGLKGNGGGRERGFAGGDRGQRNRQRGQDDEDSDSDSDSDSSNRRRLPSTESESEGGLQLQILTGVAKNYPFAESWPHRVFNGALLYTVGTDSDPSLTEEQRQEAWSTKRGMVTCDVEAVPHESFPSAAPSEVKVPTLSPIKATEGPTSSTIAPTTLESTIKKVATTLHGGLKQAGFMFDVRVPTIAEGGPPDGLTIIALETSTFLTEEVCIEVYSKSGTYEGFEQDVVQAEDGSWSSPTWGILGAATVAGQGEKNPTHLPIGALDPVYLEPGERHAFYVTMTLPEMRYTEPKYGEKSGSLFSGSPEGHLEIMVGSAVSYPFEEIWKDRIYNGAVIYALGDVGDEKFNDMGSEDRERGCPQPLVVETMGPTMGPTMSPSKGPTMAPVADAAIDVVDVNVDINVNVDVNATATETNPTEVIENTAPPTEDPPATNEGSSDNDAVDTITTSTPTKSPTISPTFGRTSTQDDPAVDITARLSGNCPTAVVTVDSSSKSVIVPYEYAVITESGADADVTMIVEEMENILHRSLMSDKCGGDGDRRKARMLQDVAYQGFNSNPSDRVSTKSCSDDVPISDGQECHLVSGGVTAIVESDADDEAVTTDIETYVESVLEDPASYESLGVSQVAYIGSDESNGDGNTDGTTDSTTEDSTTNGTDQDLTIDGAMGGNQDPINDDTNAPPSGLGTTGIIIIVAFAGVLALAMIAFVAMRVRKKQRLTRSNSDVLFNEFPDEEERAYGSSGMYGVTASSNMGYNQSFAPLGTKMSKSTRPPPPPSSPPRSRASSHASSSGPAVILNEQDDISLFSNDKSKANRFRAPDSPGSRGSNSSKKSVEFVRAGQSYSSQKSNQPEDTVDL
eukprot:CAMPEP_0172316222 /NCGR_PEP_ID=MMETSP1058-20130122/27532_1 /TAXON_ID=83371 /ORGANISM="Detonula confervacea, Strain CCMP 353" /LENGTH=1060 /DNA_ID=CAMNT_0013030487 /DNA_START=50 /DNA_END=3232 /DNA_ORIENTATION=+